MKSYAIFPAFDLTQDDDRSRAYVELMSRAVVDVLRRGGDHFHFVVDWIDPELPSDSGIWHEDRAQAHVQQLGDVEALMDRIKKSIDPSNGVGSTVRSIATCRAATFGYDGQVFLCLRHEDPAPVSTDPSLAVVEERLDYITQTDYFDGWVREVGRGG